MLGHDHAGPVGGRVPAGRGGAHLACTADRFGDGAGWGRDHVFLLLALPFFFYFLIFTQGSASKSKYIANPSSI